MGGGGGQCRLSILRNGNVPCRYFLNVPVGFKMPQCRLLISRNGNVPCQYFFKCCLSILRTCHVALSILSPQRTLEQLTEVTSPALHYYENTVNVDIFAYRDVRGFMKMGNLACIKILVSGIKILVLGIIGYLGFYKSNFQGVYIFADILQTRIMRKYAENIYVHSSMF